MKYGIHRSQKPITVIYTLTVAEVARKLCLFRTEWHFRQRKVATLVTTRSSGSSYLNRVELQNGCLSLGHSNTFIPSTLGGSCVDQQTGKTNEAKLRENLHLAIEAYTSRVDGCRCGDATIKLFKGSESEEHHAVSDKHEIFLKGSNRGKSCKGKTPISFPVSK